MMEYKQESAVTLLETLARAEGDSITAAGGYTAA